MKSRKEILAKIKEIKSDSRYPRRKRDVANVFINAPLALIQVRMEHQIKVLKWVLGVSEIEP